jgi:glycine cleavage system pyridoxal-binding protein P
VVEKAGVLNLGVEGMMIMGAVCGLAIAVETESPVVGFLAAAAGGAALSLIFAFLTQVLLANQVATGLALTLFGLGLSSLIGQGYYGTVTPPAIQRNILENPAWYTAYTPYQPEIAQGRLEALLNYQTMVADLTGLEIANASLLDEATAAAEAMTMAERVAKSKARAFFVDENCHPQTIGVIQTRALPLGIEVIVGAPEDLKHETVFGAIFQYPGTWGHVRDLTGEIAAIKGLL